MSQYNILHSKNVCIEIQFFIGINQRFIPFKNFSVL